MVPTIGTQLKEAREAQNLSLEDVRHRARIPVELILALEEDRIDAFANLTYARKFLQHYGRFLQVDVSAQAGRFAPVAPSSVAYFRYLQPSQDTTGPAAKRPSIKNAAPKSASALLVPLGLLLAAGLSAAMWFGKEKQNESASTAPSPSSHSAAFSSPPPEPAEPASTGIAAAQPADPTLPAAADPEPLVSPPLPVRRATPVEDDETGGAPLPELPASAKPPLSSSRPR